MDSPPPAAAPRAWDPGLAAPRPARDRAAPVAGREAGRVGAAVARLLAGARFELVPVGTLREGARHLPAGVTVTVTSSPRRGMEPTVAACEWLAAQGFRAVPHLAARLVAGPRDLRALVRRLEGAGVREVFVVGGDARDPAGPYPSALALLRAMGEVGHPFREVGVAGYPERHPFIPDEVLLEELRRKAPLATYAVTQICFDPRAVAAWVGRIRGEGILLPVYVGMPGPLERRKLLEVSLRVGVGDSLRFVTRHGGLVARLARRGVHRPDAFLRGVAAELSDPRVLGVHLNTFNQVEATERWRQRVMASARWASGPARGGDGGG